MRLRKGLILRQVGGNSVVMGEGLSALEFGKMLTLNETAAWLWQQAVAMGEFTVETLADKLCEEYDVTQDEARRDVAAIIDEWNSVGVIETV